MDIEIVPISIIITGAIRRYKGRGLSITRAYSFLYRNLSD